MAADAANHQNIVTDHPYINPESPAIRKLIYDRFEAFLLCGFFGAAFTQAVKNDVIPGYAAGHLFAGKIRKAGIIDLHIYYRTAFAADKMMMFRHVRIEMFGIMPGGDPAHFSEVFKERKIPVNRSETNVWNSLSYLHVDLLRCGMIRGGAQEVQYFVSLD